MQAEADRCGYPLLVKAVMGGGGKGMKLALDRSQFLVREGLEGFQLWLADEGLQWEPLPGQV